MFLHTVLFLGVVTALIELYLFARFNLLQQAIERWVWLGIVFSFSLAILLCAVFGAHGVTVMFAGIVSLCITQPIYLLYNAGTNGKLSWANPKNWAFPKTRKLWAAKGLAEPVPVTA